MTERDPFTRGSEDLPGVVREWVEKRPRWRVVQVRPFKSEPPYTLAITLVDLDPSPKREHFQVTKLCESWEPDDMREALFEAVYLFGLYHFEGHAGLD